MGTYFSLIIRNIGNLLLFVFIRNSLRIVKTPVTCCLFKIINNQSPNYLFHLVLSPNIRYFVRNSQNIPQLRTKHDFFKNSFFPSAIKEWNNLERISENPKALVFSKPIFYNLYGLNQTASIIVIILKELDY